MSSSFLKKKGENIKTRQGQKGIMANHRPWGVTDNQKRQIRPTHYLIKKNLAKQQKKSFK
jgi:hypothetical protein